MQLAHETFVVVADGRKMLFFRNQGDADYPKLEVERVREQENPADRDQGTDKPGSSFTNNVAGGNMVGGGPGIGNARSAYSETDFHQLEEDRFAAETAELLKKRALRNDFDQLIVVAPPKTLGELRKAYHKEVQSRIVGEIDKDLTGHPVEEIEKIIQQA